MKQLLLPVLGVCLLAGFSSRTAFAQGRDSARVTLTQETTVGTMTLPAGDYTITDLADHSGASMLVVRSSNGFRAVLLANRVEDVRHQTTPESRVLLQHVGNKYELKTVWMQGRDYGFQLLSSEQDSE